MCSDVFQGGMFSMLAEKAKLFGRWRPRFKRESFQKCCGFQRMKTGESLMPLLQDMHRKK